MGFSIKIWGIVKQIFFRCFWRQSRLGAEIFWVEPKAKNGSAPQHCLKAQQKPYKHLPDDAEDGPDDPGEGGGLTVRGGGDILLTLGAGHHHGAVAKAGRLHVVHLQYRV